MSRFYKWLIAAVILLSFLRGFANSDEQLWFGYIHQGRITKHLGYWLDIHHRTKNNFASNLGAELIRTGGTVFIDDRLRVTTGYAFIAHFPSLTNQSFVRPEHRLWQQVFFTHTGKRFRTTNYFRSEQRFVQKSANEKLEDGSNFRQRFRLSTMFIFCINKTYFTEGSWGVVLNNEVFVNAHSSDHAKNFDQNRAFAGFTYNINPSVQLHLGYMNVFSLVTDREEISHCIRLSAFHNIDFRKKK